MRTITCVQRGFDTLDPPATPSTAPLVPTFAVGATEANLLVACVWKTAAGAPGPAPTIPGWDTRVSELDVGAGKRFDLYTRAAAGGETSISIPIAVGASARAAALYEIEGLGAYTYLGPGSDADSTPLLGEGDVVSNYVPFTVVGDQLAVFFGGFPGDPPPEFDDGPYAILFICSESAAGTMGGVVSAYESWAPAYVRDVSLGDASGVSSYINPTQLRFADGQGSPTSSTTGLPATHMIVQPTSPGATSHALSAVQLLFGYVAVPIPPPPPCGEPAGAGLVRSFLEFGGVEVANAARTMAYIRLGLAGRGWTISAESCACSVLFREAAQNRYVGDWNDVQGYNQGDVVRHGIEGPSEGHWIYVGGPDD